MDTTIFLKYLASIYYTEVLCFFISIFGFIYFISKDTGKSYYKLFSIYFGAYAILVLTRWIHFAFILTTSLNSIFYVFDYSLDLIHVLIEFFIFSYIIKLSIENSLKRSCVNFISLIFIASFLILTTSHIVKFKAIDQYYLQVLFSIQAGCLILSSIPYYLEIIGNDRIDLKNNSSFWLISTLNFVLIVTLPFSIFSNYLMDYNLESYRGLFAMIYLLYVLLFLVIIKAGKMEFKNAANIHKIDG